MTKKIDIAADERTERVVTTPSSFPCTTTPKTDSAFFLTRYLSESKSSSCTILILTAIAVARKYGDMIPKRDALFCVLFPSYLMYANYRIMMRRDAKGRHSASVLASGGLYSGSDDAWFKGYVMLASIIGLLLPLVTVLIAPCEVASLAAPHLFVLWCQIIGESMTKFNPNCHRLVTLMVIVGFSAYRMNLVVEWFLGSVSLYRDVLGRRGNHIIVVMEDMVELGYGWGLVLSGLNLLFWTYNLFVTILLVIVPEHLRCEGTEASEYVKCDRRH